jgi:hypothetical protein
MGWWSKNGLDVVTSAVPPGHFIATATAPYRDIHPIEKIVAVAAC